MISFDFDINAFEKYYKGPYALVGENKKANNLNTIQKE
jgi:hypothetical protein